MHISGHRAGARSLMLAVVAWGQGAMVVPAGAVTLFQKSAYTALEVSHCSILTKTDDGTTYQCPGLPGVPVYFAEGDDRTFLSAGTSLEKSKAAGQTLKSFKTLFSGKSGRATIEWRFVIRNDRKVPYAMIVRYFTKSARGKGQVLVVTRITEKQACHMAYIDARANPDAIVIARKIADERAPTFDCSREPTVEGATGESPM